MVIRAVLIAAAVAFAVMSVAGQTATQPSFEVVSIKPSNQGGAPGFFSTAWCHGIDSKSEASTPIAPPPLGRCSFIRTNLIGLIASAYLRDVHVLATDAIQQLPEWAGKDFYDIEAKADDPSTTTEAQLFQMVGALLSERFKLEFHRVPKEIQGFRLTAPKGDSKLKKSAGDGTPSIRFGGGQVAAQHVTMSYFARAITGMVRGPVSDVTGLTGTYDFLIERSKDQPAGDPDAFIYDVQDQLGLRFERNRVTVDAIVIDHVDKPTAN